MQAGGGAGWEVHWATVEAGATDVSMAVVGGAATGWYGVGFSPDGAMVGSDAVLAWAGGDVKAYALNGKSPDKVVEESSIALSGASVEVRDGKTLIKFGRPLAAGQVPLSAAGATTLLWAAGTASAKVATTASLALMRPILRSASANPSTRAPFRRAVPARVADGNWPPHQPWSHPCHLRG